MRRVLLVDDEVNVLNALKRTLRQCFQSDEVTLELFTDPEQGLLRTAEVPFDVVMSDYRMPGLNGAEFLGMIKRIQPDAIRLMLSASTDFSVLMSAVNHAEVFRYVAKPWRTEDIQTSFELAFARRDKAVEVRRLADELRAIRGELTPQELEARRLEAEEPGIMQVKWGSDGSVHLD